MTTRRDPLPFAVPLGLLAASLVAAVVMAYAGVPVVRVADLPWLVVLTVAMAAVRVVGGRPGSPVRAVVLFWLNLALATVAVWLSPAFGLYLFIGYYESARFPQPVQRVVGMVGVALVIAIAQVGGPRSVLFIPAVYAAFVAVNLAVTGLMLVLDRRREALFVELGRTNDELRAEQQRSASHCATSSSPRPARPASPRSAPASPGRSTTPSPRTSSPSSPSWTPPPPPRTPPSVTAGSVWWTPPPARRWPRPAAR